MKTSPSALIPVLVLVLTAASGVWAQPMVQTELSYGNWTWEPGDTVSNDPRTFDPGWLLWMGVASPDVVTGPRIEFTSPRSFVDIHPTPTSLVPPSTYVWDYPGLSLAQGDDPLTAHPRESSFVASPGLTMTRSIDVPVLVDNVTTQTMDLTLRFEEALGPNITNIYVHLGAFSWDREEGMVAEAFVSQNNVTDWSANGDGAWGANRADIVVGRDYNFQVRIECTKYPGYEGTMVFHKPQAFVSTSEWQNLSGGTGTATVLTHPDGETASFQLNESVTWQQSTSRNRQDVTLETVSTVVTGTAAEVDAIEMTYGAMYDGEGIYLGHEANINVTGSNILTGGVATPDGQTWAMEIEDDSGGRFGFDGEWLTAADLAALGVVAGTYTFTFYGPDGNPVTTSVDMTPWTPTQVPNITAPADGAMDVPGSQTVTWDPIWDPDVEGSRLGLQDADETWEFTRELSRDLYSCPVSGMPGNADIECFLGFGGILSGTTAEGIEWTTIGYKDQEIRFSTAAGVTGDTDGDGDVDLDDLFAIRNNFGTTSGATKAGGDTDEDGDVDLDDLFNVRNNFGTGMIVPEPVMLSWLALGALALLRRR